MTHAGLSTTPSTQTPVEKAAARQDTPPLVMQLATVSMFGMMAYMAFSAVIGLVARKLGLPEIALGSILTVAGLGWMLTSQWWGRQSDRLGRRPVLMRGLTGSFASYTVLAIFVAVALVSSAPVWLAFVALLILRVISAIFYGAVPSSLQAAVADITTPDNRGRGMSVLGTGTGLGMVFGPALASILASVHLAMPLFGAAVAGGVALWIARGLSLPKSVPMPLETAIANAGDVNNAMAGVFDPRLRWPLFLALAAMLCVVSAQVTTGFFAQDRFGLTTERAAMLAGGALTAVGVALVLAQFIFRATGWTPQQLPLVGAPIAAMGFGAAHFVTSPTELVIGYFVAGLGMGFIFPAFQAGASLAVTAREQGAAFGAVNATQALGVTIAPMMATALFYYVGPSAPFVFASGLMGLVSVVALVQQTRRAKPQAP